MGKKTSKLRIWAHMEKNKQKTTEFWRKWQKKSPELRIWAHMKKIVRIWLYGPPNPTCVCIFSPKIFVRRRGLKNTRGLFVKLQLIFVEQ